ncbi:MAG: helix-turn-helix transcriptional regulator [Fibrobacteres bacterium]|nr:helix-turn-helix transcriptional regulator [Fibrobacterota bacterium]
MKPTYLVFIFMACWFETQAIVIFQENFDDTVQTFDNKDVINSRPGKLGNNGFFETTLGQGGSFTLKTPMSLPLKIGFDFKIVLSQTGTSSIDSINMQWLSLSFLNTMTKVHDGYHLISLKSVAPSSRRRVSVSFSQSSLPDRQMFVTDGWQHAEIILQRERKQQNVIAALYVNRQRCDTQTVRWNNYDSLLIRFGAHAAGFKVVGQERLQIDNLVLLGSNDTLNFAPPQITLHKDTFGAPTIHVALRPLDSLYQFRFYRISDSTFLSNELVKATRCQPYALPFPPPQQGMKVEVRAILKNGLLSHATEQFNLLHSAKHPLYNHTLDQFWIEDDESGMRVDTIVIDRPYLLKVQASTRLNCFALLWLHHKDVKTGGTWNRGGPFDRANNYIFNVSYGNRRLYAGREDIKGGTIEVNGSNGIYILDEDQRFSIDSITNLAQFRFKLLKEAKPGQWYINGYLEQDPDRFRSSMFSKPIEVHTTQRSEKKKPLGVMSIIFLSGFILASSLAIFLARKRHRTILPTKDCTKSPPLFKDPNYKHRHIVLKAHTYLLEHLDQDISMKEIAKQLHISEGWLSRVFKEGTGESIVPFLNKMRIEKARTLLETTTLPILDIGLMVGFQNAQHFRRVFKQIVGKLPSEMRRPIL